MDIPASWDQRPPPKMAGRRFAIFREDRRSFQEFILSDQIRDPVTLVAQEIMAEAKANTPRSKGSGGGDGHVQAKYVVAKRAGTLVVGDSFPYARVKVEVRNHHPRSAMLEFGNRNRKRVRMLGRAGAKFGDFKGPKKIGPIPSDGVF